MRVAYSKLMLHLPHFKMFWFHVDSQIILDFKKKLELHRIVVYVIDIPNI